MSHPTSLAAWLAYLETLHPVNVCRICVVEIEGARVLAPACSRQVEPGMVVKTDSAQKLLADPSVREAYLGGDLSA